MQPTDTAAATGDLVGQIQDNARKLGLTWQIVKATVATVTSTTDATVILDGDTVPVGAIPMIGSLVAADRVWVIVVPPGGLYIVGQVDPPPARVAVRLRRANAQTLNDITVTTVSWDTEDEDTDGFWSSGTTVTIPAGLGGWYLITAVTDNVAVLSSAARGFIQIVPVTSLIGLPAQYRAPIEALGDLGTVTVSIPLAAGDTFTVQVFADMAGNSTLTAFLTCYRVGL